MKTINLHPTSLLAGIGLTCLAFLAMAQNPQPINPTWSPRNPLPVVLLRDYVQIYEGTPYTVPPNKILMITAFGATAPNISPTFLTVNGVTVLMRSTTTSGAPYDFLSVHDVPRGLTFSSGDVVVVGTGGTGFGVAWGYLADA